ncbi:MAG TPA: GGDEF domain-containing protein, partial [Candidatus Saccharimonadales bacterium]|nr:GGDEF domain-containing protein [Candidatus Saccharimonadales bacterium]
GEAISQPPESGNEQGPDDETLFAMLEELSSHLPAQDERPKQLLQHIKNGLDRKNETIKSLEYQSHHDQLTGMYNRAGFFAATRRLLPSLTAESAVVVSWGDMDNFKPINDRFGHAVGDSLLKVVAEGLKSSSGPKDILSRFGGDEFVGLHVLDRQDAEASALRISEHLRNSVRRVSEIAGRPWSNMGVDMSVMQSSIKPADSITMDDIDGLMIEADDLMYREKRQRKEHHVRTKAEGSAL